MLIATNLCKGNFFYIDVGLVPRISNLHDKPQLKPKKINNKYGRSCPGWLNTKIRLNSSRPSNRDFSDLYKPLTKHLHRKFPSNRRKSPQARDLQDNRRRKPAKIRNKQTIQRIQNLSPSPLPDLTRVRNPQDSKKEISGKMHLG